MYYQLHFQTEGKSGVTSGRVGGAGPQFPHGKPLSNYTQIEMPLWESQTSGLSTVVENKTPEKNTSRTVIENASLFPFYPPPPRWLYTKQRRISLSPNFSRGWTDYDIPSTSPVFGTFRGALISCLTWNTEELALVNYLGTAGNREKGDGLTVTDAADLGRRLVSPPADLPSKGACQQCC